MTERTRILLIVLSLVTVPLGAWLMWRHEWYFAVAAWVSGIYINRLARAGETE